MAKTPNRLMMSKIAIKMRSFQRKLQSRDLEKFPHSVIIHERFVYDKYSNHSCPILNVIDLFPKYFDICLFIQNSLSSSSPNPFRYPLSSYEST